MIDILYLYPLDCHWVLLNGWTTLYKASDSCLFSRASFSQLKPRDKVYCMMLMMILIYKTKLEGGTPFQIKAHHVGAISPA